MLNVNQIAATAATPLSQPREQLPLDTDKPQRQITVAHEFGHAIGNTAKLKRGDEYYNPFKKIQSPFASDIASIMNIGRELRRRHFDGIVN